MKSNRDFSYGAVILVTIALAMVTLGASNGPKNNSLMRSSSVGDFVKFDVNNIATFFVNNGSFNRDPGTGNAGFEWPKNTGNTANYASGLWIGGKVAGDARVAVAEYAYEYGAGPIEPGVDPEDARWRVYQIRRGDNATTSEDFANWPIDDGAPYDLLPDGVTKVPKLIGDMTIFAVFNDNDPTLHTNMNTLPLGVEIRMTAFGFNRSDALGNNIFVKWVLINKGGNNIDSAYVSVWTDVDLGDSGDDYDGCDTTLGLGYTYNSDPDDGVYGTRVPATGFDFLQGPLVPGEPTDTAHFPDGRTFPGKKLLKMTSFIKYNNDATDLGNPNTGQEVFNYMKGVTRSGVAILDNNNNPTTFMFAGDPVTGTGWNETGAGGDRRFMMSAGPFTMAAGDTQEIVAANLIAAGASYLGSVTALKNADALVQTAYDLDFRLAAPPEPPIVTSTAADQSVILSWGEGDAAAAKAIEIEETATLDPLAQAGGAVDFTYNFQGYVVYQVANASGDNPRVVATYDIVDNVLVVYDDVFDPEVGYQVNRPVKFGNNTGVNRKIRITNDAYNGARLSNAKDYYYKVTSYTYNAESVPKTLESSSDVITVRPSKSPGVSFASAFGDTIPSVVHNGPSDGLAQAFVIDPAKITGHTYKVIFDTLAGENVWHVDDVTLGQRKISNQVNQEGGEAYPSVDGMLVKVFGALDGVKDFFEVANASGPHAPTTGTFLFNGSEFPSTVCPDLAPPCDRPTPNVGGESWGIHTGAGGIAGDYHYPVFLGRVFRGDNFSRFVPYDFELRFTATGGKAWLAFTTEAVIDVPFEIWNIGVGTPDDPSDDYRMIPWVNDANADGSFGLDAVDHPISGGDNDPETDWIYWFEPTNKAPGSAGYQTEFVDRGPAYDGTDGAGGDHHEVMARMVLVNFNGGSVSDPTFPANVGQQVPETGTILRINATKPNSRGLDEYVINSASYEPSFSQASAAADINLIQAVPNPYFGANAYERNQLNRIMRFTNLPTQATLRIFNLAGQLIRTLRKDDATSTTADWDLQNESSIPVSSGMYIVHVDIPGIGTKVLKVAVIMSEERLDNF